MSDEPDDNACADRGHPIPDDDYVCECGQTYLSDAPLPRRANQ